MAKNPKSTDKPKPQVKKMTVRRLSEKDLARAGGGWDPSTGGKSFFSR